MLNHLKILRLIIKLIILCSLFQKLARANNSYIVRKLDTYEKKIALTFDDGPFRYTTPNIIKILSYFNIKATFFLVGKKIELYPESLKIITSNGHQVASHSYNHERFDRKSNFEILYDLTKTQLIFYKHLGKFPRYFRPPYGIVNGPYSMMKHYFENVILWNVDSEDWKKSISRNDIVTNINQGIRPGSIILLHETLRTVDILERILIEIKSKGYQFVKIEDFIHSDKKAKNKYSKKSIEKGKK